METTASSDTGALSLEEALAHIVEPEEAPVVEEETEEEAAKPEEDAADESEDLDDTDESDASEEEDVDDTDSEESDDEDEYEDDEDEPDQDGPETFTVKVDGEEVEVTLDDLKQGYSGQKYVQKGMQQAAEARKQAESVYESLMQDRQHLAHLIQQAQNGDFVAPKPPSEELWETDAVAYLNQQAKYNKDLEAYQQKMAEAEQQMQYQTQAQQRAMQAHAVQEAQMLQQKIPELSDPDKAAKWRDNLLSGAQKYLNYTPEQVGAVTNHQDFLTLHYAIKYAEMMDKKPLAEKKVRKAKPAIKPGAKRTDSKVKARRAAKDKARKSGSIDDMMALLIDPDLK